MTREKLIKIVGIAMAAVVLLIFGYYLLSFQSTALKTEKVERITVYDTVTAQGYFIRDEETVSYTGGGFLVYELDDGKKVELGGLIANVYASERDVSAHINQEILQSRIDILDRATGSATYSTSEIADIEDKLYTLYSKINALTAQGKGGAARDITEEINYLLCRKQMIIATESERIEAKEALQAQLSALTNVKEQATVTAQKSGYFLSVYDGYEALLNSDSISSLTPDYFDSLDKYPPGISQNWVGKLVTSYKWYFAAILTTEQIQGIEVGSKTQISFPFLFSKPLTMRVEKLVYGTGGRVTAVFSNTTVAPELLSARTQTAAITKTEVNGLKINSHAVTMVDGQLGVYAVRGSTLKFLPIEITSTTDEYYIVKFNDSDNDTVMLYDEIVVSGRDLYDGKLVK